MEAPPMANTGILGPDCDPSPWEAPNLAYQTVNLGPGQTTTQLVEDNRPPLGWLMVWAVNVIAPIGINPVQVVDVGISVNAPGPEGLSSGPTVAFFGSMIEHFQARGPVGQLYIPWPQATVVAAADAALPHNATWRATYIPVRDPELAANLPSEATVEIPTNLPGGANRNFVAPRGATSWSVWPDPLNPLLVTANALHPLLTPLGSWTVPPAPALGVNPWNPVSRLSRFQLNVNNPAGVAVDFNVFWKIDLRTWANPV
jgi:hypothetical protein